MSHAAGETAFVICCNDSVEAVVLGTKTQAEKIKQRLSKEYFERNRHSFNQSYSTPEEVYRIRCLWAARETRIIKGDSK